MMSGVTEPLDMIKLSIDELIYIKMKGERELRGKLHAFDQHMNLVLGDVEEIRTVLPEGGGGEEDALAHLVDGIGEPEKIKRNMEMVYVRGDSIILASPIN